MPKDSPPLSELRLSYQSHLAANPAIEAGFGLPEGVTLEQAYATKDSEIRAAPGFIDIETTFLNTGSSIIHTTTVSWLDEQSALNYYVNNSRAAARAAANEDFIKWANLSLVKESKIE